MVVFGDMVVGGVESGVVKLVSVDGSKRYLNSFEY